MCLISGKVVFLKNEYSSFSKGVQIFDWSFQKAHIVLCPLNMIPYVNSIYNSDVCVYLRAKCGRFDGAKQYKQIDS